jgi:hypothetical protein
VLVIGRGATAGDAALVPSVVTATLLSEMQTLLV